MRWTFVIGAMLAVGGCTTARMAGFDALASRSDLDSVEVTGIPGWRAGRFHVGAAVGTVRRVAQTDAIGWGPDAIGSAFDNVRIGLAAKYGTIEFALNRPDLGGDLEGRCRYARTEIRDRAFGLDLAAPQQPLRLSCAYRIDGRDAGMLDMVAVAPRTASNVEPRIGIVRVNGTELGIHSAHGVEGVPFYMSEQIGYVLDTSEGGPTVAAVELTGGSGRRMLLPQSLRQRVPAAVALLTLALFWDPGNVG